MKIYGRKIKLVIIEKTDKLIVVAELLHDTIETDILHGIHRTANSAGYVRVIDQGD